ncbi:GTPase IMAP family member 6-like [Lepisosteus oculatus]|uniref:GTPase IMAP family member 6-like n=1 Tax=Lepisosteus oculatus TaxID=7918 RepID=UPI0035F524C8
MPQNRKFSEGISAAGEPGNLLQLVSSGGREETLSMALMPERDTDTEFTRRGGSPSPEWEESLTAALLLRRPLPRVGGVSPPGSESPQAPPPPPSARPESVPSLFRREASACFPGEDDQLSERDSLAAMSSRGGKGSRDRADISPSPDDLRLVLLGRSGSGKSSAGNTLLGREEFRSVLSSAPVTQRCQAAHTESRGRRVSVVDTPDLFASGGADPSAHARACLALSDPGPHAFLLVLQLGRFTQGERKILEQVEQAFGPGARPHTVVLFTHGDDLEGAGLEDVLRGAQPELRALLEHCGNRYHLFNNRDASDRRQVTRLLGTIDMMVEKNEARIRRRYYSARHAGRGEERQWAVKKRVAQVRNSLCSFGVPKRSEGEGSRRQVAQSRQSRTTAAKMKEVSHYDGAGKAQPGKTRKVTGYRSHNFRNPPGPAQ